MNPHAPFVARVDSFIAQDAKRERQALECRAIRMFIAAHPGLTAKEIFDGTGIRNAEHLYRMLAMKIIRVVRPSNSSPERQQRWYVVPQ